MAEFRAYDEIDDAATQAPSAERARHLDSEQEQGQRRVSVPPESAPPPAPFTGSIPDPHSSSHTPSEAVGQDSNSVTKHTSPRDHVSSGIEAPHSPNHNQLPSPTSQLLNGTEDHTFPDSDDHPSSPPGRVSSGIEGEYFPDSYDLPSWPEGIPSGIEGLNLPDSYDLPSSPEGIPSGIEGLNFPDSYDLPSSRPGSDSGSTLRGPLPVMTVEQAKAEFEKQFHFYNDPDARQRGASILTLARAILGRSRGSPTAKNKVPQLQAIARDYSILGENDFANQLVIALLNGARVVPKAEISPGKALTVDDFEPDPKAWDQDFLGHRTKARFRADSIPQAKAADGSFEEVFKSWPRMKTPEPDVLYGLSAQLLPSRYCAIFDNAAAKPLTKEIHHPFLASEIKTEDRPIAEAETQCQRTGSAIVSYSADWNDEASGELHPGAITDLPEVDVNKDNSTPDSDSICFTVAIAPNLCLMFVNWRELWSNGTVHWHTSLLEQYSFEYGMGKLTEVFQRHISNIIDWGVGERAEKIYGQAQAMAKRKVGHDVDLPFPQPKQQRTGAPDDSD